MFTMPIVAVVVKLKIVRLCMANMIISGTLASDVHFQAYLLDGVFRWNQDRAESAVAGEVTEHHTYSGALQHAINTLGEAVMGKKICPTYKVPLKYTGK